jgi:predicted CxxxxCH...CXXCH cytochrome family protein
VLTQCHNIGASAKHAHSGSIDTSPGSTSCLTCCRHAGNGVDNNARMIRKTVKLGTDTVPGATTRTWDYATTADLYQDAATRRGICDTPECHPKSFEATKSGAGSVNDHIGKGTGTNCLQCHGHSSATGGASFSAACNACHAHPDWPAGGNPLSGVHARHVDASGKHYACTTCHYGFQHNQTGMAAGASWPVISAANINVRFDPAMNPRWDNGATVYPRYNNVRADNEAVSPAPGASGTGACDGTFCHGNSNDAQVWSGKSAAGPAWNGTGTVVCGSCHGATVSNPRGSRPPEARDAERIHLQRMPLFDDLHRDDDHQQALHVNRVKNVDPSPAGSCSRSRIPRGTPEAVPPPSATAERAFPGARGR